MKYIDFICPEFGDFRTKNLITIKIPAQCCGITTIVKLSSDGSSIFDANVKCKHLVGNSTYEFIWEQWKNVWEKNFINNTTNETISSNGYACINCGMINEYAVPNVGDKYKCFECRVII